MQKQPIRKCQKLSRAYLNCSVFKKILIGILIIIILIIGYILWCRYKITRPPIIYQGLELYTQESYLQYENGVQFKRYIETVDHLKAGVVTEFRYCDFKKRDSILGKYTDFYWVEYTFETGFDELLDYIQNNKTYSLTYDSWSYFQLETTNDTGFYLFVDKQNQKVRAAYITDPTSWSMPRFLMNHKKTCGWI